MSYTNFNRHANMNGDTLNEIMNILTEVRFNSGFDIVNMIYGLFDGYLYDELLTRAKEEFDGNTYNRLEKVVNIISNYPKING
jgi:hypothetical protein